MRLLYLALICVLIAQLIVRRTAAPTLGRPAAAIGAPELATGDTLLSTRFRLASGTVSTDGDPPFARGCRLLVFFDSRCEYCKSIAPRWSDIAFLPLANDTAVVSWVSVSPDDTSAGRFVREHRLPPDWHGFVSREDRQRFGIRGWPKVVLVNDGLVLDGQLPWTPAAIDSTGVSCSGTSL